MEPTRQHRLNWGVNQVVPSPLRPQAGPAPQPVRRFLHERRSHGAWNLPASIGSTGEVHRLAQPHSPYAAFCTNAVAMVHETSPPASIDWNQTRSFTRQCK